MGLKVIVTGASSGIGRATALTFSKDGHDVYGTGRSASKLAETARLAKEGGGAAVLTGIGDVGVEGDVNKNYDEAVKDLGGVPDVVVLNAGYTLPTPFETVTNEDFDDVFNPNVRGVFLWLKAVLPAFKKRGSGQIVFINSIAGLAVFAPNISIYVASKFAVTGLAKAVRLELQGTGIKVASVYPGTVDTPIFETPGWAQKGIPNAREAVGVTEQSSLSPYDIAGAVTTIAYQSARSDIEGLTVWPVCQPTVLKGI